MRQLYRVFKMGLIQAGRDGILLALLPSPFLIGLVFKFGLPILNQILEKYLYFSIEEWYPLADAMLAALTPMMLAMACAFIMLDEKDEGTGTYYRITPAQHKTYILARIVLPMLWSLCCTIIVMVIFRLTNLTWTQILISSFIGMGMGAVISILIVAFSNNKVEGLAISKLSAITILGLFTKPFIPAPYRYGTVILPSFWIGEAIYNQANILSLIIGISICLLWILLFTKRFSRKV
ncbi:hypothetical protein ACF3M2_12115 [Tissierella carlieri]|jgi:fluoroquinolone transport system permease protein|uniref:hypothetical protein n=1 Tax=Tissierella carlieri TaxID=689904 RepID=UPI003868929F